jgi:dCMP deaminase
MILKKWNMRFLEMARMVGSWSKDPSTKVGAVIVDDDRRVISLGYNGFPKGVADNQRLDDRKEKYKMIVHAERNALLFANTSVKDATIFTYPFMPCPICTGMIIQSGIRRVVSLQTDNPRWQEDFEISRKMLDEAEVGLVEYEKIE